MDGAGEHFLAGAGRAVDQDGDVGVGDALGEREQREAFRVGGGRRVGAGDMSVDEGVADRGVGGAERDPRRLSVTAAREAAAFVGDHQRARGDRRGLAVHHQEGVARGRPRAVARRRSAPGP